MGTGIVCGLLAAISFGTADFTVTRTVRQLGVLRVFFSVQVVGLLIVAALALASGPVPTAPVSVWAIMVGIAAVNFVGVLLLYRAFAVGQLSVVSPIASGFAVVTGLLALATGERPPLLALTGAVLLASGVCIVTATGGSAGAARATGVPEALGSALCMGIYFWALDDLTPTLGWIWPVVITRVIQLLGAGLVLVAAGQRPLKPDRDSTTRVTIAAGLETVALVAFNIGIETAYTSITTALTSLYSAVAVLLATLFLGEGLARPQRAGLAMILCGVLLVSM